MGTSAKNSGQSPTSALVPSWLDGDGTEPAGDGTTPPQLPDLGQPGDGNRFRSARTNFNKAVRTGRIRNNLARAVSEYVRVGLGGSGGGAARMRNSSRATSRMIGFGQAVAREGFQAAANRFGIADVIGKTLGEAVARVTDAFTPPGGPSDDAITRSAWNDTLLNAVDNGITNFENLTGLQWAALIEFFIARTIELRILNDIGNDTLTDATNVKAINGVEAELHDLISGSVHDRIGPLIETGTAYSESELQQLSDGIYELAFAYLEELEQQD